MVVRNNYFWLNDNNKSELIANGDIIEVLSVNNIKNKYGFRFANITIKLVDFNEEKELDVLIMLDTIKLETSSLPYEDYQKLYQEISREYKGVDAKKKIKENKYLNALQVKFSYSITAINHKVDNGKMYL